MIVQRYFGNINLPNDWQIKRLSSISDKIWIGLVTTMTTNYVKSGVPLIRNSNIRENKIETKDIIHLDNSFAEKNKSRSLREGDVVTVHTGDIGTSAVVPSELDGSQGFATLNTRVSNQLLPEYLSYFFNSYLYKNQAYSVSTGDGRNNLNMKDFVKSLILLPSLEEQKKIAQILSTWDEAIEEVEKLIEKKKLVRKRFYQDLIRGNLYTQTVDHSHLTDLFDRVKNKNSENNSNVLTISAQDGLVSQLDYFNKDVSGKSLLGYYIIQKGDFAYNRSYSNGYPFGAIKRLDEYDKGVVSTLYLCFRPKVNKEINSDFYMHFFEAGGLNREISKIAQEGARNHGLLNVAVNDFLAINIPHPDIGEQDKIANILNTLNKKLNLLIDKKRLLTKQKKGLMQRLLTGKVRVN